MTNTWRIGIDLGGTSFKCGLISSDDKIFAHSHAPIAPTRAALTHYMYQSVAARMRVVVAELGNDAGILGAAYSAQLRRADAPQV